MAARLERRREQSRLLSSNKWLEGVAAVFVVAALLSFTFWSPEPTRWFALSVVAFIGAFYVKEISWPVLALFIWACISLLWAPDVKAGLFYLAQYAVVLLVLFTPWRRDFIIHVVCWAVVLAVLINAYRPYAGGFGNPNFQAEFLCLALPFCVAGVFRGILVSGAAVAGAVTLLILSDSTTPLGALAGFVVLYMAFKRHWWLLGFTLAGAANVVVFWYKELFMWSSVRERLELWWNTAQMWLEAPVFGHGVGSFNFEYYRFQEAHPWADTLLGKSTVYAGAAHNEPLQVLATLGLVGAVLALIVALRILKTADPLALSVAGVAISLGMFGFPLQNASTLALVAFGGSFAIVSGVASPLDGLYRRCRAAFKHGKGVFSRGRELDGFPAFEPGAFNKLV